MAIKVGDKLPSVELRTTGEKGPQTLSTEELFSGRRVALFAVPGAFTPGCSQTHMPGFVVNAERIFDKGIDQIACLATNDAFVMNAWQRDQNAEHILMLSDGNGDFIRQLGLELDATAMGMGIRSQRFALIANDGVVEWLGVDAKGVDQSSAETLLGQL